MNSLTSGAMAFDSDSQSDEQSEEKKMKTTTPGGRQEMEWKVVMETSGLTAAQIIVGRLEAEGIPARAWQEGAGQAFGLTVGLLGTGYVLVPVTHYDQAERLLAEE